MCTLAGYTGKKAAAPILIDMLRREQYIDGGRSTGIATIHEGKLYTAKVIGNVDDLLAQTDALNFPGTVGIAHSRPKGNYQSHAHPFVDKDENLALIVNGTMRDVQTSEFDAAACSLMQGFLDRGFPIRSAVPIDGVYRNLKNGTSFHDSEPYALFIGDKLEQGKDLGRDILTGTAEALDTLPADIVMLIIHRLLDGQITAGRITRPMVAGVCDGETYLASTALAFPEDVEIRNIVTLPTASVCKILPGSLEVTSQTLHNVKIEEPNAMITAKYYAYMEAMLAGQKDSPKTIYDLPMYTDWRDLWSQPFVDCKYAKESGLLKPYAATMYDVLWAFHKEGRLHTVEGNKAQFSQFWIDPRQ